MKYEPVVLEKNQYFKSIDYDKKYSKAMDELAQNKGNNQNVTPKQIAYKIADYEYPTNNQNIKEKKKQKDGIEIDGFL